MLTMIYPSIPKQLTHDGVHKMFEGIIPTQSYGTLDSIASLQAATIC